MFAAAATPKKLKFNKMEKKGLSEIIAVLGILLMTFSAVVFLIGLLVPYVRDNLNKSTECNDYKDYFLFEEANGFNCKNDSAGEYWMSIKTNFPGGKESQVKGFKTSFTKYDGSSEVFDVINGTNMGNVKMVYNRTSPLLIPLRNEIRTFGFNTTSIFEKAEILPILKSGRACEVSDSIDLTIDNGRCD